MQNALSYLDYRKNDIHGTVQYPAMMVAPVQKDIITAIINDSHVKSLFDPFHGSGTALYEAFEINPQIRLIGCDINPLANLITRAKLNGISENIEDSLRLLFQYLIIEKCKNFNFPNEEKWFRKDILKELKIIRHAIMHIPCKQDRIFFWCIFSDIVRKYSNTRATTYKLHIKKESSIQNIQNKVISDYRKKILQAIPFYKKSSNNYLLFKCDILDLCTQIKDNEYDLTITSPPYGDNLTTVAYGQFSILALQLIDKKDLILEGWELNNYSIIDSHSMGGVASKYYALLSEIDQHYIHEIVETISEKKQHKVRNFLADYFAFLSNISRITNKQIVMTLGNRTVDGQIIYLNTITSRYLQKLGWNLTKEYTRKIPRKRIPLNVSSVNNAPVQSIQLEYIDIFERK